jgi:glutamate racemase
LLADLPQYKYIYYGDNARSPYGNRSFETVTQYTQQCVETLLSKGCNIIILACNTASAKALRTIQQNFLPTIEPYKRVLGVIRPTTEIVNKYTKSGHVGILGTTGTINSLSYPIEISKFFPDIKVYQQACPLWVPLIENNEHTGEGADYFIKKYLNELLKQSDKIDTIILGCTHYPLIIDSIKANLPENIQVLSQSEIVSHSFQDYLVRHPDKEELCLKEPGIDFYTSDDPATFDKMAKIFFGHTVVSKHLDSGSNSFN